MAVAQAALETMPDEMFAEIFMVLLGSYGIAAALELARANRKFRNVFIELPVWRNVAARLNVSVGKQQLPYLRLAMRLNDAQWKVCGACFAKTALIMPFVPIDNSKCPLCDNCLAHVWDTCESVRRISFASPEYRDALLDAEEGLTITHSEARRLQPRKIPRHIFLNLHNIYDERGIPRHYLRDVYNAYYPYSAGQPGMNALERAKEVKLDIWRDAAQKAYRLALERLVHHWDADFVLKEIDYARGADVNRVQTAIDVALEHGKELILRELVKRNLREHVGVSFPIRIDVDDIIDIFEIYDHQECRLTIHDSVTDEHMWNAPLSFAKPRGDVARYIDRDQFRVWNNQIRRMVPLFKAFAKSYQDARNISPLPRDFLERNLRAYYRQAIGPQDVYPDGTLSSSVKDALVPSNVDEALRIWHFFRKDTDPSETYDCMGDHVDAWAWGRTEIGLFVANRVSPPGADYSYLRANEPGTYLPHVLITEINAEIKNLTARHATNEVNSTLAIMIESARHGESYRGLDLAQLLAKPNHVHVERLKKLLTTRALRKAVGTRVLSEWALRQIVCKNAERMTAAHLIERIDEITFHRIETDDFRPVSDRRVTFRGLPFPSTTWWRFENDLGAKVRRMISQAARKMELTVYDAPVDRLVEALRNDEKLTPGLEAYVRSDRFEKHLP